MAEVALIETKPTSTNFDKYFEFEFERFALCSDSSKQKILKKDVDLEFDPDNFDWIILVGAEPFKHFTRKSSVTEYNGKIIDEKFMALINPAIIKFKPEAKKNFEEAVDSISGYVSGKLKIEKLDEDRCYGIQDKETAIKFLQAAIDAPDHTLHSTQRQVHYIVATVICLDFLCLMSLITVFMLTQI